MCETDKVILYTIVGSVNDITLVTFEQVIYLYQQEL